MLPSGGTSSTFRSTYAEISELKIPTDKCEGELEPEERVSASSSASEPQTYRYVPGRLTHFSFVSFCHNVSDNWCVA